VVRKLKKGRNLMKFCKLSLLVALFGAVCLPAGAQTALKVNIPFNFVAAGKSLPAGQYRVTSLDKPDNAWVISNDQVAAVMLTRRVDSTQKTHRPSLVFLQAGGAYSLVQIWNEDHSGRDVPKADVKKTLVADEGGKFVEIGAE
jgi:hypothetical protein